MSVSVTKLSFIDWLHEFSISVCAVLALASILTPLLVFHGVHTGVVDRMREQLKKDPSVLVIIPSGSKGSGFTQEFIDSISEQKECEFSIGRTRNVASELQLFSPRDNTLTVSLEATSSKDPILKRNGISFDVSDGNRMKIVLSANASRKLDVAKGDRLEGTLGRRSSSGKFERKKIELTVTDILPAGAISGDYGFIDMELLFAIQDYRDGLASELLNTDGNDNTGRTRYFESFRTYVHSIDELEGLEKWFTDQNIAVKTRSKDVANIRNIDRILTLIILIITLSSGIGFFAFMVSTIHSSVRRKWKMLGMLRLIGFSQYKILLYPISQALITGVLGVLLAFGLYSMVAFAIDTLLEGQVGSEGICVVHTLDFVLIFTSVQLIVVVSSLKVALTASKIDPSIVIRE